MARTAIAAQAAPGAYSATGTALTMTAADVGNSNSVVASGKDLIIAQNTDVGAHTVTITSVADDLGRTGDITAQSLAAGEIRIFGPMLSKGWQQSDGKLYFQANDATVKFAIVQLP